MTKTTLVNVKKKECDVYIGRRMPNVKFKAKSGHDGYFGNPYRLEDYGGNREDCIRDFRNYFFSRLAQDKEFFQRVHTLKDKILGCWCWPDVCHGEVIVEYLNAKES